MIGLDYQSTYSSIDKRIEREEEENENVIVPLTARELAKKKLERDEKERVERDNVVVVGVKRKRASEVDDGNRPSKKGKKTAGMDADFDIEEDVFFRVNYDKFCVYLRNKAIIKFAGTRINTSAASVMRSVLNQTIDKIHHPQYQTTSPPITTLQVAHLLSDVDLAIEYPSSIPEDPSQAERVNAYLEALVMDEIRFLEKQDERGSGTYVVNFGRLISNMRLKLMEDMISEKYGRGSCRLFRLIRARGKLEEKQVHKLGLLPQKEVRHRLYELFQSGIIDSQEVPKTQDRAPSRTIFLWSANPLKALAILLENLYQSMCNLYERLDHEICQRKRLLSKVDGFGEEHGDLQVNVDGMSKAKTQEEIDEEEAKRKENEAAMLEEFETIRNNLEGGLLRLDEMVMVVRDF